MVPIEVLFGIIVFVLALIGLVRGFLRELGVTAMMIFTLFFLSLFEPFLKTAVVKVTGGGIGVLSTASSDAVQCWLVLGILLVVIFISYQGETLAYGGQPPRGTAGTVLALATGTLNGYLVAGSIWYYMDKFNYPIQFLGFASDKLSNLAKALIPYLPTTLFGQPILFGQSLLLYLSIVLILARVIR